MKRAAWSPALLLDLFVFGNLSFLALDILVAHSVNRFAAWQEWIPFGMSVAGPAALVVAWRFGSERGWRATCMAVGWSAVAVGAAGLLYHLESQFFREATLRSLVYTAPFVAPLSYSGIGFLLLMNRSVPDRSEDWGRWVLFFSLGGFFGNFVLSLCDHAQNGFYHWSEWIPVVAAAMGVGFLTTAVLARPRAGFLKGVSWLMALQILVGVAGFCLHVMANLSSPAAGALDKFIYGAPVFAPLLFPNLALLALLGVWHRFGFVSGQPAPNAALAGQV